MAKLGVLISSGRYSFAVTQGAKVISQGSVSPSTKDIFGDLLHSADFRKLKSGLKSAYIVTDAVTRSLKEKRDLNTVALFRLSLPEGSESPPLVERELAKSRVKVNYLHGGHGYDGRVTTDLDVQELKRAYEDSDAEAFVVTSPFANLYPNHEIEAKELLKKFGATSIWTSSEVSSMPSLLDRETTAVLSALSQKTIFQMRSNLRSVFSKYGVNPTIYFARNDGGAMGVDLAEHYPLDSGWSVQAHYVAGVSKLKHQPNCIVLGPSDGELWLSAARDGAPIIQNSTFLNDMLLHVSSPMTAIFSKNAPKEVIGSYFELFSALTRRKEAYSSSPNLDSHLPFKVLDDKSFYEAAAISSTFSSVALERKSTVPPGSKSDDLEKILKKRLENELKMAGARSGTTRYGKSAIAPGSNLPEGTLMLSLSATGRLD